MEKIITTKGISNMKKTIKLAVILSVFIVAGCASNISGLEKSPCACNDSPIVNHHNV